MSSFRVPYFFHAVAVLGVMLATSNSAYAQGRGGFNTDDGIRLLSSERVQKELELVDDQIEQLEDLQTSQRDEMREMFMEMREIPREERREAMEGLRTQMKELSDKHVNNVKEILLPHQVARWEQLKFQSKARRSGGTDRLLSSDSMAEQLNITEEQKEEMKEKAKEIRESMQEKIDAIRAEALEELLSVLTPEQQEQYRELAGESFTFDDRQQRGRGAQGGGRRGGGRGGEGGRGGRRGGDRGGRPPMDEGA